MGLVSPNQILWLILKFLADIFTIKGVRVTEQQICNLVARLNNASDTPRWYLSDELMKTCGFDKWRRRKARGLYGISTSSNLCHRPRMQMFQYLVDGCMYIHKFERIS